MKSGLKLTIVLLGLFFLKSLNTYAQVGKEFWFVAPEITVNHSETPALFRITAFTQPAKVKISMPANPAFTPINLTVPANKQVFHQFPGTTVRAIENGSLDNPNDWTGWTAGKPFNKGLLIESDEEIAVYYEIANGNNPDRFTLKGGNALGTDFMVPSQNLYYNWHGNNWTVPAREQVDIVATENNTQITITVTDDVNNLPGGVVAHAAGSTFTITLNRGQTYCLRSTSAAAARHLGGTRITSTKPIAVTISDDSIAHETHLDGTPKPGHYDLVGDQLIPIRLTGTEYVAINTLFNINTYTNTGQKVFVLATEDNTTVSIDGTPLATLQQGQIRSFDITGHAIYITSNKPVYVYQFASVKYELGSAILPNINCTGSQSVTFARIYDGLFAVQILTQRKNLGHFSIRDDASGIVNTTRINNLNWQYVPGSANGNSASDNAWYAAVENMSIGTQTYTILNDNGLFHLSVLDANGASMSYGYFSSYNGIKIDGPSMACFSEDENEKIRLFTNQAGVTNLNWYFNDPVNGVTFLETAPSTIAHQTGEYWVEMEYVGCQATDRLYVEYQFPDFTLGDDMEVCYGETIDFLINGFDGHTFNWSPINNTTNSYSFVPEAGQSYELSLTITDPMGCASKQTVHVTANAVPVVTWDISGNDICIGDRINLLNPEPLHSFQWSLNGSALPGETNPYIDPITSGVYELVVTSPDACSVSYSQQINVRPLPAVSLSNVAVCPGTPHTYTLSGYSSYLWHNGSTSNSITLTQPNNNATVEVTNIYGCKASAQAIFEWYNEQVFTFGKDTSVCGGLTIDIAIDNTFTNYNWFYSSTGNAADRVTVPAIGNPSANNHLLSVTNANASVHQGTYYIEATDMIHGCAVTGDFNLTVLPMPIINIISQKDYFKFCEGDTLKINIVLDNNRYFSSFQWYKDGAAIPGANLDYYEVLEYNSAHTYSVLAEQSNGCYAQGADVAITPVQSPEFDFFDAWACPGEAMVLQVGGYRPGMIGNPDHAFKEIVWWNTTGQNPTNLTYSTYNEGTYKVTVYDHFGCFRTKERTAQYYQTPEINLTDASFCDGSSHQLIAPAALQPPNVLSYQWNNHTLNQPLTVTNGGSFTLNIRDNNPMFYPNGDEGCLSTATINLTKLHSPVFNLGNNRPACEGSVISIETDPSYTRYEWNGNTIDGQTNAIQVTNTGTYSLRVWNNNNCYATNQVDITSIGLPSVDLGDDLELCGGILTTLTVGNYPQIIWSTGQRNVNSIQVMDGNVSVKVVDNNGCEARDNIHILWRPVPNIDLGPDLIICPPDYPITINAIDGFQEYIWHNGSTFQTIQANLLDTVNVIRVRNEYNCWGMDSKIITYAMEPEYRSGGDFSACEFETITLDAGTYTYLTYNNVTEEYPILSYIWNQNNALTDQNLVVNVAGEFIVEVFDGCYTKTDRFNVAYYSVPEITGLDSTYYAQVTVFTNPEKGTQPFSYNLNNGRPQTSNTFKKVPNGDHTIYLIDARGCEANTSFQLASTYQIDVPNFFTPNGDGFNDSWVIDGLDKFPDAMIAIYDRYGKLLKKYRSVDPPWDGTYLNRPVPSDDYWYVIELVPIKKFLKGNVSVKR